LLATGDAGAELAGVQRKLVEGLFPELSKRQRRDPVAFARKLVSLPADVPADFSPRPPASPEPRMTTASVEPKRQRSRIDQREHDAAIRCAVIALAVFSAFILGGEEFTVALEASVASFFILAIGFARAAVSRRRVSSRPTPRR